MNIAIIGYGKMGKTVEKLAKEKGHKIVSVIDPKCPDVKKEITEEALKDVDVCIDFTHPDCIIDNITSIAKLGKNIVVGTTGWYDKMDEVKAIVEKNNIGMIWSGNFSIGVNAFFRIIESASKTFNNLDDYDVMVSEFHHKGKADSPSGTAKMIGDIIIKNIDRKKSIVTEELKRAIKPEEMHIASIRGGSIPGIHTITFDSPVDTIELKHTARGREGFATGAIMAAEFIKGKKGLFSIDDMMKDVIKA
ncbi:4-hydroxy-tetrahydrodipicolinate reductase [Candidatus Woesearchaeota archaeon]|nr:4-hydroxy-tetrahydrodipicolinate reductase [Candidatus Woesearchaeota archaeon]